MTTGALGPRDIIWLECIFNEFDVYSAGGVPVLLRKQNGEWVALENGQLGLSQLLNHRREALYAHCIEHAVGRLRRVSACAWGGGQVDTHTTPEHGRGLYWLPLEAGKKPHFLGQPGEVLVKALSLLMKHAKIVSWPTNDAPIHAVLGWLGQSSRCYPLSVLRSEAALVVRKILDSTFTILVERADGTPAVIEFGVESSGGKHKLVRLPEKGRQKYYIPPADGGNGVRVFSLSLQNP